jgi:ketosteroid isomerase-like protein
VNANLVLWDLAPDQRLELPSSVPAVRDNGVVAIVRREGTVPDGGPFESVYIWLCLMKGDRITHLELFEVDAIDAALARFEELRWSG